MGFFINKKRTVDWLLGTLIGSVIGSIFVFLVIRFYGSIVWVIVTILALVCIIAIALYIGETNIDKLQVLHIQSVLSVTAFTLGIWSVAASNAHFLIIIVMIIIGGTTSVFITEFLMKRTKRTIEDSNNK